MDANRPPTTFSADLCGCNALGMLTPREVTTLFMAALDRAGARIVDTVSHAFPKTGLTCALILRESHAVLHTWPESGTAHIDIFSCTAQLRSVEAIRELGQTFGAQQLSIRETTRADGHADLRA